LHQGSYPDARESVGCPNWSIDRILEAAGESGYSGFELRFYQGSLDLPKVLGEFPGGADAFRRRCDRAGVAVCCLDTSVVLTAPEARPSEGERMMELAQALGAPYLRVFGGEVPEGESRRDCVARAARKLALLGRMAQERGLRVLLETHDAFSSGAQVGELLAAAGEAGTGALWDLHHPVRMGESPAETARLIGKQSYHVHVKDAKRDGTLSLLGQGDLPLRELLAELHQVGYQGYLSLEWEKAWHPELAEPEVAFPQAAGHLTDLLQELGIPRR